LWVGGGTIAHNKPVQIMLHLHALGNDSNDT